MDEGPSTLTKALAAGALLWSGVLWSICLLGWRIARARYRHAPRSPLSSAPASAVPGVSILRPLKGLDANLYENLESSFVQEYANFEVIFSVASEHDQALDVVRRLIEKYPGVRARVIVGAENVGVNPKINNLVRPFREAANDIVWVLDSNVDVHPGTLARSVDALLSTSTSSRPIGLVHHLPLAVHPSALLGSRVEEAFLNTTHAKMYLAINALAVDSCVMGKSNMYRRSDVVRLGGLEAFARFLAEDNMIAKRIWADLGMRHAMTGDVARNAVGNINLRSYLLRRVRWIRVRKYMVLAATLVEPFTESLVAGALAAWALRTLVGPPALPLFALNLALWFAVDVSTFGALTGVPLGGERLVQFAGAWAVREALALPVWVFAMAGSEIGWREMRFRVLRNGEAAPVARKGAGYESVAQTAV